MPEKVAQQMVAWLEGLLKLVVVTVVQRWMARRRHIEGRGAIGRVVGVRWTGGVRIRGGIIQ